MKPALILLPLLLLPACGEKKTCDIQYEVSGTSGQSFNIHYAESPGKITKLRSISVPWTQKVTVTEGANLLFGCVTKSVTCEGKGKILADGKVVASGESGGTVHPEPATIDFECPD